VILKINIYKNLHHDQEGILHAQEVLFSLYYLQRHLPFLLQATNQLDKVILKQVRKKKGEG